MARILLAIGSDSGDQLKRWPWHNWINLARLIVLAEHQVIFVGTTPDEIPNIDTRSYADLKAALRIADLVVCNDNGIMHVADYLGVKTIGLFGPTSVLKNLPFNGEVVKGLCPKRKEDGCYQNGSVQCALPLPCLAAITPPQVMAKIKKVLAENRTDI